MSTSSPQQAVRHVETRLSVNLDRVAKIANAGIVLALVGSVLLGHFVSFYFHFLTVFLILLNLLNVYWRHVQKTHTLLANFGFAAQVRYLVESIGPEFRQYLYSSDNEERPFSRNERTEVYRKAKGIDSSAAFGTQLDLDAGNQVLLRHSFFPTTTDKLEPFAVTFGEERELAANEQVAMLEIKFSQGAKPGKGGLLPKEKLSEEIAELRGVPMGQDVISPPRQLECVDEASTVAFIRRIQEVAGLPVGIKFCLGRSTELRRLVQEMKRQGVFPDFMTVDGAEGGTGAAPRCFMDGLGLPLLEGLTQVQSVLEEEGVRDRLKLIASGKLIDARRQLIAMSIGADACYTARGFMLALGCIQALQCNQNTCPVGITTHNPHLERGLDIEAKSTRVANYVAGLCHNYVEMLAATGNTAASELNRDNLFLPGMHPNTHQGGAR